jgi:hypothetical protein
MRSGINFAKVITVLAIIFGVSLGLCGLTAVAAQRVPGVMAFGMIELVVILLSGGAIVVMLLAWGVVRILGGGGVEDSGLQKLFDDEARDGKSK